MLPGLDANPLKREFKRLMKRAVPAVISGFFDATTQASARSAIGAAGIGAFAASGANNDITSLGALSSVPSVIASSITSSSIQVSTRQTVLSGPVDTNGFPTFLPATSVNLNLTSQNVSTGVNALVATAAGGANASGSINAVGQSTANLTWTGCTASNTNYLPVSIAAGALTALTPVILAPIYQWGGTPAVTANQYTYNIQQGIMYLGNGATASAVNHVIVGEAVAGASTITSTVAYAYQGRYEAAWVATLPGISTQVSSNHNIGTSEVASCIEAQVTTAENGYSVGDTLLGLSSFDASVLLAIYPTVTTKVVSWAVGGGGFRVQNKTTGGVSSLTNANYKYRTRCWRSW